MSSLNDIQSPHCELNVLPYDVAHASQVQPAWGIRSSRLTESRGPGLGSIDMMVPTCHNKNKI